jgi:hypothetical protein
VTGRVLVNNLGSTPASSFRISFPPGIPTQNFTDIWNDANGLASSRRDGFPTVITGAYIYADTANDRVVVSYDTDNNATLRQWVEFSYNFKIIP